MFGQFGQESRESMQFCDLALRALPRLSQKDVRSIYESIKQGKNSIFNNVDQAMGSLAQKMKLNIAIDSYTDFINDPSLFSNEERERASSYFVRAVYWNTTSELFCRLEQAFNLKNGCLLTGMTDNFNRSIRRINARCDSWDRFPKYRLKLSAPSCTTKS